MNSVVFLARSGDSRVLRAQDFLSLRLDNVELMSLAACQTAVSAVSVGAEPFGFLRGLLGSGVSSVLLTEWEIDAWFLVINPLITSETPRKSRSGRLGRVRVPPKRRLRHIRSVESIASNPVK